MGIFRNTTGVGISLTRDALCTVVLTADAGTVRVVSTTCVPLTDEASSTLRNQKLSPAFTHTVERALEGVPQGAPRVVALWESDIYTHVFPAPPNGGDLTRVAQEEATRVFPDDLSMLITSEMLIHPERALVAGVRQSLCEIAGALLSEPTDFIEPESFSLVRGLMHERQALNTIFITAGLRDLYAIVYDSKGFAETVVLDEKEKSIDDILAEKLTTTRDAAETLRKSEGIGGTKKNTTSTILIGEYKDTKRAIEEIFKRYKKAGSPIEHVIFSGAVMDTPGFVEFLSKSLKVDVFLGDSWTDIGGVEKKVQRNTEYAIAVGAALRALLPNQYKGISFYPKTVIQQNTKTSPQNSVASLATYPPSKQFLTRTFSHVWARVALLGILIIVLGACAFMGYRWEENKRAPSPVASIDINLVQDVFIGTTTTPTGLLRGTLKDITIEATNTFLVTAPATRNLHATGEVVITNTSSQDIILRKGTRMMHTSGIEGILDVRTPIGTGKSVTVSVTTSAVGANADIAPGDFVIPGLPPSLRAQVVGKNEKSFTGGLEGIGGVSDTDKGYALDALRTSASQEATATFLSKDTPLLFPDTPLDTEITASDFVLDIDKKTFHASARIKVTTMGLLRQDVNKALEGVLQSKLGSESTLSYAVSEPRIISVRLLGLETARATLSAEGLKR